MKRLFIALALLALSVEQPAYAFQAATAASATKNAAAAAAAGQKTATSSARVDGMEVKTTVKPAPAPQAAPAKKEKPKAPPVRSKPYLAFCPKGATPEVLAARVEESYRKDGTGQRPLAECHVNPIQLAAALNDDPDARITDEQSLLRYLREDLKPTTAPAGSTFYSDCLLGKSKGPEDVKRRCGPPRALRHGEAVYANKHTGFLAFLQGCANPGVTPAQPPPPCDLIVFRARKDEGDNEAHLPIWGAATSERCYGYQPVTVTFKGGKVVDVKLTGEWRDVSPDCPFCGFDDADEAAASEGFQPRSFTGAIKDLPDGYVAVRVDPSFSKDAKRGFGICIERVEPSGQWYTSGTAIVRSMDYRTVANRQRVAYVYYTSQEMEQAGHRVNDAGGLYLWP